MNETLGPPRHNRLADLLLDPREALDVEIKDWLDLADSEEDKAKLAKALLALANHGGGFVLIGLTELESGTYVASGRESTADTCSQDAVNGIVQRFAEPTFHCSVYRVPHPSSGAIHPVVSVPGGHRVPIRAKRSGPNDRIVRQHAVYIRRPGPSSEEPTTGREWDGLFTRCLNGRRDELLDLIRGVLVGQSPATAAQSRGTGLDRWIEECEDIWRRRAAELPQDSPARCPHGFFMFAYRTDSARHLRLPELLDVLSRAPHFTGWPPWWVPTREGIAPYPSDGAIECWIGGDTSEQQMFHDAGHSDFWRVAPDGRAFLLRGYQEDAAATAERRIEPGTGLDLNLPIWRTGEGLLHAGYLAEALEADSIVFAARYTGLRNRRLVQWGNESNLPWASGVSREDDVSLSTTVAVDGLSARLVDGVHSLLSPLYEHFSFSPDPPKVCTIEAQQRQQMPLCNWDNGD